MKNLWTLLLIAAAVWACSDSQAAEAAASAAAAAAVAADASPSWLSSPWRLAIFLYAVCGFLTVLLLALQLLLGRDDPRQQQQIAEIVAAGSRLPSWLFHPLLYLTCVAIALWHALLWPWVLADLSFGKGKSDGNSNSNSDGEGGSK